MSRFSKTVLLSAAACILFFPLVPLAAQEVVKEILLDDGQGPPDNAFGLALSPDGARLFVAVCGDVSNNNNRLVEIDTMTNTVVNEAQTGLYPEEIAFKLDGGVIQLIFVSDSTDGTVTVLKPDLSLEATLQLASYSSWPFGLLMDPSGRYLYVTTFAVGEMFVIDTDQGPDYLKVVNAPNIGGGGARMALHGNDLIVPGSDFNLGAFLKRVDISDPRNPSLEDTLFVDGNMSGWPGANDVAVDCGRAYVPVLDYNGSPLLYEVDLDSSPLAVSRVIDTSTQGPLYSLEHGIGASPDGNTLVVTYYDFATIKAVGSKAGCVLFSMDVDSAYGQINEAVFSLDGELVYLSNQAAPKVYVVKGIPRHGLYLHGTESAPLGGAVDLGLIGGEAGARGLLLLSASLGPIVTPKVTLDIGWPFIILKDGPFDSGCELSIPTFQVPMDPGLQGLEVYLQGLTQDGDLEFRPSNLLTLTIL